MIITNTFTASEELRAARAESADWKEVHSLTFGLLLGQQVLDVRKVQQRLNALSPEVRERMVDLLQRWVSLSKDAKQLLADIDARLL